jgi:hypothetical protein
MTPSEILYDQLASEIGGKHTPGNFGDGERVTVPYKQWEIILELYPDYKTSGGVTFKTNYTIVRTLFTPVNDFKFSLYRKSFIDSIASFFHSQDITIGYPDFDKAFIVKGSDEFKIQTLLSNDTIRETLQSQKDLRLEIVQDEDFSRNTIPTGARELYFSVDETIESIEELKTLHNLFKVLIDELIQLNEILPLQVTS